MKLSRTDKIKRKCLWMVQFTIILLGTGNIYAQDQDIVKELTSEFRRIRKYHLYTKPHLIAIQEDYKRTETKVIDAMADPRNKSRTGLLVKLLREVQYEIENIEYGISAKYRETKQKSIVDSVKHLYQMDSANQAYNLQLKNKENQQLQQELELERQINLSQIARQIVTRNDRIKINDSGRNTYTCTIDFLPMERILREMLQRKEIDSISITLVTFIDHKKDHAEIQIEKSGINGRQLTKRTSVKAILDQQFGQEFIKLQFSFANKMHRNIRRITFCRTLNLALYRQGKVVRGLTSISDHPQLKISK